MRMTDHIDPTKEAFAAFRAADRPGPTHMLNLVRLRAHAAYKSYADDVAQSRIAMDVDRFGLRDELLPSGACGVDDRIVVFEHGV